MRLHGKYSLICVFTMKRLCMICDMRFCVMWEYMMFQKKVNAKNAEMLLYYDEK